MKQRLSLKQRQSFAFNAHFSVAVRLLQMPISDLNVEIRDQMDSNPLLEEIEAPALDRDEASGRSSDAVQRHGDLCSISDFSGGTQPLQSQNDWLDSVASIRQQTLRDHISEQLSLWTMTAAQRAAARVIVSALDERGFLQATNSEICAALPADASADEDGIEEVVDIVQQCEPHGIAARDLKECLILQLRHGNAPEPVRTHAAQLLQFHMERLAEEKLEDIAAEMHIEQLQVDQAVDLIRSLNPNPGNGFGVSAAVIVPDILVSKEKGVWHVQLNDQFLPKLRISDEYSAMIDQESQGETGRYLENCLQAANVLLDNLKRRHITMLRVAREIIRLQKPFLEHGERSMIPLTLGEIAEHLDLSESTVSRACAGKYAMTPQGTLALKRFFPAKLRSDDGQGASSIAVKHRISAMIGSEHESAPLSDQQMSDKLRDEGLHVSRRTVAKYRSSMGLATKRLRVAASNNNCSKGEM